MTTLAATPSTSVSAPLADPDNRMYSTRAQETREAEVIHPDVGDDAWKAPMMTDAPEPRPGYVQRWVRASVLGQDDASNLMRKHNEGWQPRTAETVPSGYFAPVIQHARYGNIISNGDSILMERPVATNERQKAFEKQLIRNQTAGIERYLSRQAPGGNGLTAGEVEKFDRQVSKGRQPKIADD